MYEFRHASGEVVVVYPTALDQKKKYKFDDYTQFVLQRAHISIINKYLQICEIF